MASFWQPALMQEFKFRRENAQRLTIFFADMVGFTGKGSIETVRMMKLIQAFEEITLPLIEALKGTLIRTMGDGLLAVFKHPLNATIAALRIQKKIEEYNQFRVEQERFRVRVGLNTGDVIRKGADVFGDTVNVASRMETSASPGEVRLTQTTFDEIKEFIRCTHLGPMQVKGKAEPIAAYSAEEILIDVDKVVAEGQANAGAAASTAEGGSLANLKESMFTPEFDASAVAGLSEGLARTLASVFQDMSKQLEGVAQDYHEEYLFKRYLQEKWNQLIVSARQGMSTRGGMSARQGAGQPTGQPTL